MTARLGIDFGTTNTVVAWADRGNFPVTSFTTEGESELLVPSVMAWNDTEFRFGREALDVWSEPGWHILTSPKRWLGLPDPPVFGETAPEGLSGSVFIEELLTKFFEGLHLELTRSPNGGEMEDLEIVLGIPANANSLQRLRTVAAAERAGFQVLQLMHEPTAAAIEHAHRHRGFARSREDRYVAVYDLGGGTFDAAVVKSGPAGFEVIRSGGIERLGGDDFDRAMAELALAKQGRQWESLSWDERHRLLFRCRESKEALRSTTKKWLVDLEDIGEGEVAIYSDEYYERCLPLIEKTVATLAEVLANCTLRLDQIDALLLVGGGSQMPLVRRRLKEIFGSRMKISPHPFASTSIGLAIQADRTFTTNVEERFSRHFGVWREADGGSRPQFDTIFDREALLPAAGETLVVSRSYHPSHNIGHFRFEECAAVDASGNPLDQGTEWCEIFFPFDPGVNDNSPLSGEDVARSDEFGRFLVHEHYECDSKGMIRVRIERASPPLSRSYLLYGPESVEPLAAPAPAAGRKSSSKDELPIGPPARKRDENDPALVN